MQNISHRPLTALHYTLTMGVSRASEPFATGGLLGLVEVELVEVVETVVDGVEESALANCRVGSAVFGHSFISINKFIHQSL
jgi:hypothetical protein